MYAALCGWTLARAHARSGDRIAIAAYLGGSDVFDRAIAEFAVAYADQNERDHQALVDAVKTGRITAERDVRHLANRARVTATTWSLTCRSSGWPSPWSRFRSRPSS